MKSPHRVPLAAIAVLAAAGALLLFVPLHAQEGYSRSRWIAEGMRRGLRFSGGIMPGARTPELEALLQALPPEQPRPERGARGVPPGLPDTRVSHDILSPNGASAGEPGTEAEPYLAVDPEDPHRLLAFYQEDRFPSVGGARALTFALSTDGGRHWREGLLPKLTTASGGTLDRASDPWVAFGRGGAVYCSGLAFDDADALGGIYVSASRDGGETWDDPVQVHAQSVDAIDDKDAVAVDDNPQSPYFGRVYVGWDISPSFGAAQTLVMAHSSDGGRSFSPPATIFGQQGNIGIIPLVDPEGVVHAIWLHYEGGTLRSGTIESSYSADGGDTWSPPVTVADISLVPVPSSRTGDGLPGAAIDPATGNVFVVWQDQRFTPGIDQVVLSSSANGRSGWSFPRRISDGPANAFNFTPAVAVNDLGQVAVSYYSMRNDPSGAGNLVDEYLTVGGPRGRPFSRGRRQSIGSWDVRAAAVADGQFFLGDYQGLAAAGHNFMPLWVATFATSPIDPPAKEPDVWSIAVR